MAVEDLDASALTPLETPVLKVSRPVAACSRCRSAKIKCDGKLPACTSCEKNGRAAECTSTNGEFARGKERSYVSTLETRIEKLHARIEEAKARQVSVISNFQDPTNGATRQPSNTIQEPPTPNTTRAMRRNEATAIDDLVSDFGFLSVNATARDFYGFTSAMSYARLILSACSKEPLPEGMAQPLPPRYAASSLVQHYLHNVFVLLPVLDEAAFYASMDHVYSRSSRQADPIDHWMVHMVLAISSASRSEQRGDQNYMQAVGHVCAALEHSETVLHPGSIASVQALILLTEYATLDPHHFDSWNLIGAASRAMVDLGIHQDPPKGTIMPRAKLELRRRVFYCIYVLDRSTSLVQTRAFSFSDDSTKVKIPFNKLPPPPAPSSPPPSGSQKSWLQSYDHAVSLINLRKLQSTWYNELFQSGRTRWEEPYQFIWNTCDTMRDWFDNLPASIGPNMRAFFELDLLYSYVYVLSPSPRVPVVKPFAQKLIFEYCIRYADLMLSLMSDPTYTTPLTFYDAMRVYMTGRQFLDVLQHNTEGLLTGHIPPPPNVSKTTAPPPPMPMVPLQPGEPIPRFNTIRSLRCIKQITECLSRFGVRWGYMSWNQRYQTETTGMVDELNRRLSEMDAMSNMQEASIWTQASIGSVPSSNGSSPYHSPPMYQQGPVTPNMTHIQTVPNLSPPSFPPTAVYSSMSAMPSGQTQPQFQQPVYNFHHETSPSQSSSHSYANAPPDQQFAHWHGYTEHEGMSDAFDDDTIPPESDLWNYTDR